MELDESNENLNSFSDNNESFNNDQVQKNTNFNQSINLRISSYSKFINNPMITKFNINSRFIYDLDQYKIYLSSVKNANYLKPNQAYIDKIKELINLINLEKDANRGKLFIKVPNVIYNGLIKFSKIKPIDSPLVTFIKKKFQTETNRENLSCRKLAGAYFNSTWIKTNRQTVCDIIKYKIGFHYRKTTIKNNRINSNKNILIACTFLKIITKCINLGFKLIYCDESGFKNKSNNFYTWKKANEEIFFDYEEFKKFTLILAVDDNNVLHYKINTCTTNSESFLEFVKELNMKLLNLNYNNYVLILDNLSSHKTKDLIEYYAKNKINVLFNAPYLSYFNAIELAFRTIKKKIYASLFSSGNSQKERVIEILSSEEFKKSKKITIPKH